MSTSQSRLFKAVVASSIAVTGVASVSAIQSTDVSAKELKELLNRGIFTQLENGVLKNPAGKEMPSNAFARDSFELSIMHFNDSHSNAEKMPKLVTAVNEVRAERPDALLLNAGDVFSGTLYFNEFKGMADLQLMNLMKVDAMTFGNHEFDLGSSAEGHKALADFIKAANFPFVSANVDFSNDALFTGLFNTKIKTNAKDSNIYTGIVKVINGERVGIFGLTTAETESISSPGSIAFENYIEEAKKMVTEFEKIGVNKVVALTHIGYDDNVAVDNDIQLATAVEGIDVIVGGHSHTELKQPVVIDEGEEPTVIVQAYQYADYLGQLDLTFDKKGVVREYAGKLIKTADKAENAEAAKLLETYSSKIREIESTEIGATATDVFENPRLSGDLTKPSVRKNETALGNLITDGMLVKAKRYNSNVIMALQNGGGIRSAIDAGPITVGEVIKVLPFGNTLATMELTGAEIKQAFETSFKAYPAENGGFLHVAGAKVVFDSEKPAGSRVVSVAYQNAEGSFTKLKDSELYTIATNAFTAKGGDGYEVFAKAYAEGRVTDLGLSDWENFRDHLVSLGTVTPKVEGRIVDAVNLRPKDVLISEYIEGSSFNKAIEIYNGTGKDIDLSQYTLELYSNGAATASNKVTLAGTLKHGDVYVLYHKDANEAIKVKGDLVATNVINFNGDDAVVLRKSGQVIDSIGQVGFDPGTSWGTTVKTADMTLLRKTSVITGDTNISDEFIPEAEWTALPKDDASNLGLYTGETSSPENPTDPEQPPVTNETYIHDIQGAGHTSPLLGQKVAGVEGIVTFTFTSGGSHYYMIQTPDAKVDNNSATSEAVLLYSGKNPWPITVGDKVSVSGTVSEYAYEGYADRNTTDLKTTQINVRDDQGGQVTPLEKNVALPKPVAINELKLSFIDSDKLQTFNPTIDAIDYWESLEGMRVQVADVKAVAPQEHGDLVTVLKNAPTNTLNGGLLLEKNNANPNRIQFRLEPNVAARDFDVITGDQFKGPITGVVGYSYQNYKIYASLSDTQAAHVKGNTTPEKTSIVEAADKLTIASYNLENFSNNTSETSADKAQKLARAIGLDMNTPDIIGVTEVQDNNGSTDDNTTDASQSYERLIAEIEKQTGVKYAYLNINPVNNQDGGAPGANIRVGFLYNPERVTLPAGINAGDATTAVVYDGANLTLNPGRIDPTNPAFSSSRKPLAAQFVFNGQSVIVIANHWNSKGGDTPLFGAQQPPVYGSEAQRKQIAQVVYNFIADIKGKNPNANVVSLGDFNDFQFSDALAIHEGSLMTNMMNKLDPLDRYTYVFQGNSQVLDHILVSKNLDEKTVVDALHINADFTDRAGRASDHDPVMVQIDFTQVQ